MLLLHPNFFRRGNREEAEHLSEGLQNLEDADFLSGMLGDRCSSKDCRLFTFPKHEMLLSLPRAAGDIQAYLPCRVMHLCRPGPHQGPCVQDLRPTGHTL